MLGIQWSAIIEEAEVIPSPFNILNDFDGIAIPFGVNRYTGEKSSIFKEYAHRSVAIANEDINQLNMLLGLETRTVTYHTVIENTSTNIYTILVSDDYKLYISKYEEPSSVSPDLYKKTSYVYDLLNRDLYPFLEELLAKITIEIGDLRGYISPFSHSRYNHILPYHLSPIQKNYDNYSYAVPDSKRFFLPHNSIVPDSVILKDTNTSSNVSLKLVKEIGDITSDNDVHINYKTGEVNLNRSMDDWKVVILYDAAIPISHFLTTPSSIFLPLNQNDIFHRVNTYSLSNYDSHKYIYRDSETLNKSKEYNGVFISPEIKRLLMNDNTNDKNRWDK